VSREPLPSCAPGYSSSTVQAALEDLVLRSACLMASHSRRRSCFFLMANQHVAARAGTALSP